MYMNIRLVSILILLSAVSACRQSDTRLERPNIVFILTDDQRWDAVGYVGNRVIHTPEIDRLAAEGTKFVNAFSTTPICAASRASYLTGLHERTHRYTFQVAKVRDEYLEASYPRILRNNGYYTGFVGKLGVNGVPVERLFDFSEVYDRNSKFKDARGYYYKTLNDDTVHLTRYTGERAMQFIDSVSDKHQPFCLSISFSAPHGHDPSEGQYFWDPDLDDLYQNDVIDDPELGEDLYFERLPTIVKQGFNRTRWYWRFDTPEKYQRMVKGYYRMISGIDREVGRIRERLKKKGLEDNTIIIFASDNGYFLGDRQLADKWLMYEPSIRIPLIVYDPGEKSGRTVSEMALNVDVPSTILDYAGIDQPENWQGKSLAPATRGIMDSLERDEIFVEHLWQTVNIPPSEGVRTRRWKYLRYINDKSIEELYDLERDPVEAYNLAGDSKYSCELIELRKRTDEFAKQYSDPLSGVPTELLSAFAQESSRHPDYSWKLPAQANDERGHQILVSTSRENLDLNIGDMWDSGRVMTPRAGSVRHKGTPLQSGNTYYWKVRIWDQDNRETNYSAVETIVAP